MKWILPHQSQANGEPRPAAQASSNRPLNRPLKRHASGKHTRLLRESAISNFDEMVGNGLPDATAAAVWTVRALTPMIAIA
jgi:hypothetical protein